MSDIDNKSIPFDNAHPLPNKPAYNTYVGARYVPLFDGGWDKTKAYEPLVVVSYGGDTYTSKTYVPAGIDIKNENYWAVTGNYNAQIETYREEVREVESSVDQLSTNFNQFKTQTNAGFSNVNMLIESNTESIKANSDLLNSVGTVGHPFYGKKVLWLGDSLSTPSTGFGKALAAFVNGSGGTLVNLAVGGHKIADCQTVVNNITETDFDCVGVWIGINSIAVTYPNTTKTVEGDAYYTQYYNLLTSIRSKFSSAQIFATGLSFFNNNKRCVIYSAMNQIACNRLGIPFISLLKIPNFNPVNMRGSTDGLHPTASVSTNYVFPYIMNGIASRGIICQTPFLYRQAEWGTNLFTPDSTITNITFLGMYVREDLGTVTINGNFNITENTPSVFFLPNPNMLIKPIIQNLTSNVFTPDTTNQIIINSNGEIAARKKIGVATSIFFQSNGFNETGQNYILLTP